MLPVGRMGDLAIGVCTCHKHPINVTGTIMSMCSNVLVNGKPIGRMSDIILTSCGHIGTIISGSSSVLANSMPIARMSDITTGCFIGTIIQGSMNVLCK